MKSGGNRNEIGMDQDEIGLTGLGLNYISLLIKDIFEQTQLRLNV